jgi:signal transduction histidine kinase
VWAALASAGVVLITEGNSANLGWFSLCFVGGWCALRAGTVPGLAYWTAAGLLFGAEWLWAEREPGWAAWTAGVGSTVVGALLVRHQLGLVEQMRALQADLAQRSRAEERNRIARDLHDVIAHGLTVSLLHVSSARLAVDEDPAGAARALADAERLTRQSLADVRATVGLLRAPGDGGIAPPAPGLGDLPRLVTELQAALADVSLVVDPELDGLPATTGTTVYRIVQESLTNAARHAPGSPVQVRVAIVQDQVEVSVESDGVPGNGAGMGLVNMAERAEAVGGSCRAGPGGRGWLVRASLPRGARAAGRPS